MKHEVFPVPVDQNECGLETPENREVAPLKHRQSSFFLVELSFWYTRLVSISVENYCVFATILAPLCCRNKLLV